MPNFENDKKKDLLNVSELVDLGVFFFFGCRLISQGVVWCALALQNARATELMKVVWSSSWFLEMVGFTRDTGE